MLLTSALLLRVALFSSVQFSSDSFVVGEGLTIRNPRDPSHCSLRLGAHTVLFRKLDCRTRAVGVGVRVHPVGTCVLLGRSSSLLTRIEPLVISLTISLVIQRNQKQQIKLVRENAYTKSQTQLKLQSKSLFAAFGFLMIPQEEFRATICVHAFSIWLSCLRSPLCLIRIIIRTDTAQLEAIAHFRIRSTNDTYPYTRRVIYEFFTIFSPDYYDSFIL